MDEHVGIGEDLAGYVLHPGDTGLVLSIDEDTVGLLIFGHIVYVRAPSVQLVE